MTRITSFFAVAAGLAIPALAQTTLVVPTVAAATDGNTSSSWPFDLAAGRFLYIYDSAHFTGNGVTYPILISGIRWRANAATATWTGSSAAMTVDLSTAPVDYAAISTTWASNHGVDQTQVFNGTMTIAPGSSTAGVAGPFHAGVAFATPFLYDPTLGDLVIDTTHSGLLPANTPAMDAVTTAGATLAKRVYSTTNPPAATATLWSGDIANVLEFTYVPANGLFASFTAGATTGNAPLAVNFTSTSYSSDPGGITAYAWDFDGDTVVDSTLQNPTFVYNTCGTYTVSLTVFDGSHPAATETKTGYVTVDPIGASFTASPAGGFGPLLVNFTDTSPGLVTTWMWDFDGDTVIDSTQQNPSWTYTTPGQYSVTLTTFNACRTATITRTNLITVIAPGTLPAPPELLQYQFNEVRGQEVANTASTTTAPAQGAVNVANWWSDPARADFRGNEPGFGCLGYRATGGASVNTGFPMAISGSFTVSFWMMRDPASTVSSPFGYPFGNGTFRAFTGAAGIIFSGTSLPSYTSSFSVTPTGVWMHIALVVDDAAGVATWYKDGVPSTNTVSFTPNTFTYTSTANLAVGAISTTGGSPIAAHYSMDDFRFYTRALLPSEVLILASTSENATAGVSGLSCPGTLGVPVIGSTGGAPTQGNAAFAVTLSNAEDLKLAAIAMGFTPAAFGTFDLSPWLGAGCVLQNDAAALNFTVTSGNAATQAFGLPSGTGLTGLHVYAQWAVLGTTGAATKMIDINIR